MARFIAGDEKHMINIDNVTYLFVRDDGDVDVYLIGSERIILKGSKAKAFLHTCKVEYDKG